MDTMKRVIGWIKSYVNEYDGKRQCRITTDCRELEPVPTQFAASDYEAKPQDFEDDAGFFRVACEDLVSFVPEGRHATRIRIERYAPSGFQ